MNRHVSTAFVIIGFVLAIWHADLAIQAIMVFRSGEGLMSWATILLGPVTTVIAAIVAVFSRKVGAYLFIVGSIGSFAFFSVGERSVSENTMPFLVKVSIPMFLVGIGILFSSPASRSQSS